MNKKLNKDDKKWSNFNKRLERAMIKNDLFKLAYTYAEQVKFLKERKKDYAYVFDLYFKYHQLSLWPSLKSFAFDGYEDILDGLEIINGEGCCKECAKAKKIYTVEEAIKEQPLPIKNCENVWCRCDYAPVLKKDN